MRWRLQWQTFASRYKTLPQSRFSWKPVQESPWTPNRHLQLRWRRVQSRLQHWCPLPYFGLLLEHLGQYLFFVYDKQVHFLHCSWEAVKHDTKKSQEVIPLIKASRYPAVTFFGRTTRYIIRVFLLLLCSRACCCKTRRFQRRMNSSFFVCCIFLCAFVKIMWNVHTTSSHPPDSLRQRRTLHW